MEGNKPTTVMCTVLAIDHSNLSYRACSLCERTLPDTPNSICRFCNSFNPSSSSSSSSSKRLFRLLVSIATDTKVLNVICFDRAARILFGCSADEFFDFAKIHPFAAANAGLILEGEMFKMTLSKPKNGNAQHLRAVSVLPLRTGFQPAIVSLRELYGVRASS
ncbi:uncharacterized protein LOC110614087 isoform X2 [Manihot esculenta]|uniref:Replication factor A C-terminal domain-containing protein n=1 Tax=Manihot esculenta TaxID=3983 RepID=A0A2C9W0V8_MANES|nr:uncharacterized protein LOC110614087 isoform X2 [Manihot esculenta]OAY51526.1 hypothetical protein MANES_04G014200v8 [Manihot esculenta]